MSKQPTDARREVGNTDLEIVDKAIADHETLQKDLYVLRRILGEIGKLDQLYRGLKEGIAVVQAESARAVSELEAAKAELAKVKQQVVETKQELATLTAEAEEKRRELSAYSEAIDRIVGKAAA